MTQEAKIIIGISLITLVILVGGVFFLNRSAHVTTKVVDGELLVRNDKHIKKTGVDKIAIVEFADFQCPACAQAHPTINQLLEEYKGTVTFIYRHFPLPQHGNAILASKTSEAAGEQGKFWEMYDLLYENQNEWSEHKNAKEIFTNYAKRLKLDLNHFTNAIEGDTYNDTITLDKNDGITLGVNSTPTFFINGKKLTAFPTYLILKQSIEEELKQ